MNKVLTTIVLLFLVSPLYANCGNDNGNGNGCSNSGTVGPQGPQGDPGINGTDGSNGANGTNGLNGLNGKDANVDTRMIAGGEVRIASEKYFDVNSFVDYDMTYGKVGFFGMRIVLKPGKSYEERIIEKQQKQIDRLEHLLERSSR